MKGKRGREGGRKEMKREGRIEGLKEMKNEMKGRKDELK